MCASTATCSTPPDRSGRSPDAIHLAGALRVAALTAVLTCDIRMAEAAASLGLPVAAPALAVNA